MQQLELLAPAKATPAVPARTPRQKGAEAEERGADRARRIAPDFTLRARDFVIRYLVEHGRSWGEDIVDAAKLERITPVDARHWGHVFSGMANKQIRCIRSDGERRKGHGTSGAKQWDLIR